MGLPVLAESRNVYMEFYLRKLEYLKKRGLGNAEIEILKINDPVYQKTTSMSFAKLITASYNENKNIGDSWFSLIVANVKITGGKAVLLASGSINARFGGRTSAVCIGDGEISVPQIASSYPISNSMSCFATPVALLIDEGVYTIALGVKGSNVNTLQARGTLAIANVSEELLSKEEEWQVSVPSGYTSGLNKEILPFGVCYRRMDYSSKLAVDMKGPFLGFACPLNNSSNPNVGRMDVIYNGGSIFANTPVEDDMAPTSAVALASDGEMRIEVYQTDFDTNQSLCITNYLQLIKKFKT